MRSIHLLISVLLALFLVCLPFDEKPRAENIRKPAWAGKFYPADRDGLKTMIDHLTRKAEKTEVVTPPDKSLKALILPHAGYIYSGYTAAHASRVLKENRFEKVVMMGSNHHVRGLVGAAVSDVHAYQTPLGTVRLHGDAGKLSRKTDLFRSVPESDAQDHTLEVILPFLQVYLKQFELVPIIFGSGNYEEFIRPVAAMIDQDTLLVASTDLSHYLRYHEAVSRDKETIDMILGFESDKLLNRKNSACGKAPVLILLDIARKNGWEPVLLHYSNSGDMAGSKDRVVGYAAIAFFGNSSPSTGTGGLERLKPEQARVLIRLARLTIMEKLGQKAPAAESDLLRFVLKDAVFQKRRGTFVTLSIDSRLRGCIGNLAPTESILAGVRRNAVNAAFRDRRFPSITSEEMDKVDIEISILTAPKRLEYTDKDDLLSKLRENIDGVIIRKGSAGATYLPQVWKQLPRKEDFLGYLCRKAGLPADTWKKDGLEVLTYQVQYYEEEK